MAGIKIRELYGSCTQGGLNFDNWRRRFTTKLQRHNKGRSPCKDHVVFKNLPGVEMKNRRQPLHVGEHFEMQSYRTTHGYTSPPLNGIKAQTSQCDLLISEKQGRKMSCALKVKDICECQTPCFAIHFYGSDGQTVLKRRVYKPQRSRKFSFDPDHEEKTVHVRRDQPGLSYCWRRGSPHAPWTTGVKTSLGDGPCMRRWRLDSACLYSLQPWKYTHFSQIPWDMSSASVIAPNYRGSTPPVHVVLFTK